jgi:hypothetical protein
MAGPAALITLGLVTFAVGVVVWWRNRGRGIHLSSVFLLVLSFISLSVSIFYYGVLEAATHGHEIPLVIISRMLWGFILVSTLLVMLSTLNRTDDK